MNYLFTAPVIAFTAGDRVERALTEGRSYEPYPALGGPGFAHAIEALLELYTWEHTQAQLNLLDSHDTARMLTLAGGDIASLKLATVFQMTYPGAPSVFDGDEIGLGGAHDPDSRRGMPWDTDRWNHDLLDYFKRAIALRHAHPVLRHGTLTTIYAEGLVYGMARHDQQETLLIVLNVGQDEQRVRLPVRDLMADGNRVGSIFGPELGAEVRDGQIELDLPARSGVVLAEQP